MTKRTIANSALSNLIKKSITEDIILGRIRPGEKLIETKYAEEFGTSRAPIREAFYLLTLEGFVQKIPRKGTVVRGFTIEEIEDLLGLRCYLEGLALDKIACKRRNIHQGLKYMDQLITEMEKSQRESRNYANLNYEFHYQLILASESEVIHSMYERLGAPLLSVQTMAFMEEQNIKKSLTEHKELVGYLRQGQMEEAKRLLDSHNNAVFPRIEKYFSK
jgi:DNA-binding GntR family transcriptional regulator